MASMSRSSSSGRTVASPALVEQVHGAACVPLEFSLEPHAAARQSFDLATEHARYDFAEGENLKLIHWAVREAPELLRMLRTAYLFGQDGLAPPTALGGDGVALGLLPRRSKAVTLGSEKLKDVEREHIHRVLEESTSLEEAAVRLGISNTTLWRKRRRYNFL
jgi:hypothetical protein